MTRGRGNHRTGRRFRWAPHPETGRHGTAPWRRDPWIGIRLDILAELRLAQLEAMPTLTHASVRAASLARLRRMTLDPYLAELHEPMNAALSRRGLPTISRRTLYLDVRRLAILDAEDRALREWRQGWRQLAADLRATQPTPSRPRRVTPRVGALQRRRARHGK